VSFVYHGVTIEFSWWNHHLLKPSKVETVSSHAFLVRSDCIILRFCKNIVRISEVYENVLRIKKKVYLAYILSNWKQYFIWNVLWWELKLTVSINTSYTRLNYRILPFLTQNVPFFVNRVFRFLWTNANGICCDGYKGKRIIDLGWIIEIMMKEINEMMGYIDRIDDQR